MQASRVFVAWLGMSRPFPRGDGDEAALQAVLLCHDGASSKWLADTIKKPSF
jgi:hypothetical protein